MNTQISQPGITSHGGMKLRFTPRASPPPSPLACTVYTFMCPANLESPSYTKQVLVWVLRWPSLYQMLGLTERRRQKSPDRDMKQKRHERPFRIAPSGEGCRCVLLRWPQLCASGEVLSGVTSEPQKETRCNAS